MTLFPEIDQKIKKHLASDEVFNEISEINNSFDIPNKRALAKTLSKLVKKEIPSKELVTFFSKESKLQAEKANLVVKLIKQKILEPIKLTLQKADINIDEIIIPETLSLEEIRKREVQSEKVSQIEKTILDEKKREEWILELMGPEKSKVFLATLTRPKESTISLEAFGRAPLKPIERKVSVAEEEETPKKDSPFILHKEQSPIGAQDQTQRKKFSFSLPFKFFASAQNREEKSPVIVRIETPKLKRVVHYSESRTPVTPFESADSMDIRNFEKPIPLSAIPSVSSQAKPIASQPLIPTPPTPPTPSLTPLQKPIPKLEKNTVDLRSEH